MEHRGFLACSLAFIRLFAVSALGLSRATVVSATANRYLICYRIKWRIMGWWVISSRGRGLQSPWTRSNSQSICLFSLHSTYLLPYLWVVELAELNISYNYLTYVLCCVRLFLLIFHNLSSKGVFHISVVIPPSDCAMSISKSLFLPFKTEREISGVPWTLTCLTDVCCWVRIPKSSIQYKEEWESI